MSNVSQTKTFVTADTGPPFIVSMKLSSNNSYGSSLAKPNDNIVLTFVANERLSETGAQDALNNNHPKNSPKSKNSVNRVFIIVVFPLVWLKNEFIIFHV